MKNQNALVHLLAIIAMFIWGMSYVWSKKVFEVINPAEAMVIRLVISLPLLMGIAFFTDKLQKIKARHYALFLLSAILNPFIYFIGESYGLQLVTPSISAVMIATIPIFTPLAGVFVLREKLLPVHWSGMILSVLGISLLILATQSDSSIDAGRGILFLSGAVLSAVVYGILLRKLTLHYSPVMIVGVQNLIGIFLFLPLALLTGTQLSRPETIPVSIWLYLFLLGMLGSAIAFVFYTRTVKEFGLSKASLYTNLIPVFTALSSYYFLNEQLTFRKLAGIGIVLTGLMLSQYSRKEPEIVSS